MRTLGFPGSGFPGFPWQLRQSAVGAENGADKSKTCYVVRKFLVHDLSALITYSFRLNSSALIIIRRL
jgi:hypothetical protein